MNDKKVLLTGLQPSGTLHIGNYFGSLKPFLDIHSTYHSFLMVADYHALTSAHDAEQLQKNTKTLVTDYLALGLNVDSVTIFKQSDNQDHMELAWILNCLVTVPFLKQSHAYKDKVAKGIEPNAGLFTYPMLQAADIALYNADVVPVGEDQRQHLEYTREVIRKLNHTYKQDVLKEPETLIIKSAGILPGTDGQKMSKSYKNTIPLFGTEEDTHKAVMSIVTDSSSDDIPENVYNIHKLFRTDNELEKIYSENKGKYKVLKEMLAEDINSYFSEIRERRKNLDDSYIEEVLTVGKEKARKISSNTLGKVRDVIGIN